MATPIKVLALAARSLRLDIRSDFLHWLRGGFAATLLVALIYIQSTAESYGAPGLRMFVALVEINYYFIWVLGLGLFATVISEEREEGALPLLQMAGLSRLSILFGKSSSLLLTAVSLLAVQLPFAMFMVTLGGVSSPQVLGAFAVLLAFLLSVYSIGLFASSLCMQTTKAVQLTFGVLLMTVCLPRLADGFLGVTSIFTESSVGYALRITGEITFATELLYPAILAQLGLSVLLFLSAWICLDLRRESAQGSRGRPGFLGLQAWDGPRPAGRMDAAITWKDYHWLRGGRKGMVVRLLAYALVSTGFGIAAGFPFSMMSLGDIAFLYGMAFQICLVLDIGFLGSRLYREELRADTLAALLALPGGFQQIARAKSRVAWRTALPGVLVASTGVFLGLGEVHMELEGLLLLVGFFPVHGFALYQVATWASLKLRRGAFPIAGFLYAVPILAISYTGKSGVILGLLVALPCAFVARRRIPAAVFAAAGCDPEARTGRRARRSRKASLR